MISTTAHSFRHSLRDRCAFTLLELVIVLLLMVGLLAVVWPNLMKPLQRTSLDEAAQMVREAIDESRHQASLQGTPYFVRLQRGSGEISSGCFASFLDDTSSSSDSQLGSTTFTVPASLPASAPSRPTSTAGTESRALAGEAVTYVLPVRHWRLPSPIVVARVDWTGQHGVSAQSREYDLSNSLTGVAKGDPFLAAGQTAEENAVFPPGDPVVSPTEIEVDLGRQWWIPLTAEGRGRDVMIELVDRSIGQSLQVSYSAATGALEISR